MMLPSLSVSFSTEISPALEAPEGFFRPALFLLPAIFNRGAAKRRIIPYAGPRCEAASTCGLAIVTPVTLSVFEKISGNHFRLPTFSDLAVRKRRGAEI